MKKPTIKITEEQWQQIQAKKAVTLCCPLSEYNRMQFRLAFAMYPHSYIPMGVQDEHNVVFKANGKEDISAPCWLDMQDGQYILHVYPEKRIQQ